MRYFKILLCLLVTCSAVMGIGLGADADASTGHTHQFVVSDKTLYNVRSGPTHTYVSGYKYDPITGVSTPVYGECHTATYQYRGTYRCGCGATDGFYYYPDEPYHSACGQ